MDNYGYTIDKGENINDEALKKIQDKLSLAGSEKSSVSSRGAPKLLSYKKSRPKIRDSIRGNLVEIKAFGDTDEIQNDIFDNPKKRLSIVSYLKDDDIKNEIKDESNEQESKEWNMLTEKEKLSYIGFSIIKIIIFILLLYLFLLSLSFMTIGFTMVSSFALKWGDAIRFILANPFAALAIGIIATAIMQNATATTSIAVSMVGAGIIPDVKNAVPIIMGANIGTCVTNSFIALTLAGDPEEFKRAFSGATLNDGFNLLSTAIMLPLEIFTRFLYLSSNALTDLIPFENAASISQANFVSAIINPVIDLFILLNNTAVDELSNGNKDIKDVSLRCCKTYVIQVAKNFSEKNPLNESEFENVTMCEALCTYWCMPMLNAMGDGGTGLFWIIFSIVVLIASLFGIVKVLSLLIVGPIAKGVTKAVNASFPGHFNFITEIILFIIALLLTLIVQSSNIITATLVPLCGIGIITLQRVYVMTLGSNIGTTVTGILSAFTTPPSALKKSMQLAFVYTFFNSLGVVLWLPIPFLRFPKIYASKLGEIVFQYRWFLYVYVAGIYFIIPLIIFGLALIPNWIGLAIVGLPIIALIILLFILKFLQAKAPRLLPEKLKDLSWLPLWMRSLEPYDHKIKQMSCCKPKIRKSIVIERDKTFPGSPIVIRMKEEDVIDNISMTIPNAIRRLSVVDSLISESRRYSAFKRSSANNSIDGDNDPHFRSLKGSLRRSKRDRLVLNDDSLSVSKCTKF